MLCCPGRAVLAPAGAWASGTSYGTDVHSGGLGPGLRHPQTWRGKDSGRHPRGPEVVQSRWACLHTPPGGAIAASPSAGPQPSPR